MAGLVQEQNPEKRMQKQIGCMSGFLQIFDRQQILAGKRIHSTKRLPPSTGVGASPETVSSGEVHEVSRESGKAETNQNVVVVTASVDSSRSSPAEKMNDRRKSPAFAPTAVVDGERNQRRSTSVIARLMGLEPLSCSDQKCTETVAKPALERSVSESRVLRDPVNSKYIDDNNFQVKQPIKSQRQSVEGNRNVSNKDSVNSRAGKTMECANTKGEYARTTPWRSRSFFDSTDFFPEPNQTTMTMHEDFEKKLKMRGMGEQSNDLSTLKQILEVLQLKGLLHSTSPSTRDDHRNFVYDGNLHLHHDESSIVVVEPRRNTNYQATKVEYQRSANDSRGARGYATENYPATVIKRDGGAVDRSGRIPARARASSPNRIKSNLKSCNSIIKRKPLSFEIQRRDNDVSSSPKRSPIDSSSKLTPKRNGSVHHSVINRSPRNRKPTESSSINSPKRKTSNVVTEDESSSISESIFSTPSTTDSERSRCEEYKEGKSLLHRCDKLIHSIKEMNSVTTESPPSSAMILPSPVSVLDSVFDSPIPSVSHSIDSKATPAVASNDQNRSPKLSPTEPPEREEFITSHDSNFTYISEIIRASQSVLESSNVFFSIEKQYSNTENTSDVSKLQRKLVFDVVYEIIDRNRQLPPWKVQVEDHLAPVKQIWTEFQKLRETKGGDGLLELVSDVLKRDLVEASDWRDYPIETSETVLEIERMIFKELVGEAIRDLAEFSGECMFLRTRRKLVF